MSPCPPQSEQDNCRISRTRDCQIRRPHRRSPARHRPPARTPDRPISAAVTGKIDVRGLWPTEAEARMSLHKEINFEIEICDHLAANGWLYAEGDAAQYDRARALFPADVLAWVQATQPKAWEALTKNHGAHAGETLLTACAISSTSAARSMCCGMASRCSACERAVAGAVQARPGHQPRHPGPLRAPTGCASCGRCGIRCTTRTASTWCCS